MAQIDYGNEKLNALIETLRGKLPEYLLYLGVIDAFDPQGKFSCVHPDHPDFHPSMGFVPCEKTKDKNYSVVRCFSRSHCADIFKVAAWAEGRPESGPEWVTDNVYWLADKLNLDYERIQPSEESLRKARLSQLYEDAADCLVGLTRQHQSFELIDARGLDRQVCVDYGVGTVKWDLFFAALQAYGNWDPDFITENGITERLFGSQFITITLRDHRGRVVAFDRRFAFYDADEHKRAEAEGRYYPPKFERTPAKIGLYDPETFLYGLDKVTDPWRRLDLVEGYFDVISAVGKGHKSIVGTLGTDTLKDTHFDLLVKIGFRDFALIGDEDPPGLEAVARYIDRFGARSDLRLFVIRLGFKDQDDIPLKDRDPDTFFRLYGWKNFERMPVKSAYLYKLVLKIREGVDGVRLVREMLPALAAETDAIKRGERIRDLANSSHVHEDDIREEVKRILSGQAEKVVEDLHKQLKRAGKSPDDVRAVLADAQEKMGRLAVTKEDDLSKQRALQNYFTTLDQFHNSRGAIAGYRTGIALFDTYVGGFQKHSFAVVGGPSQSGKTAYVNFLVHGMLVNEARDHCVLVHSLDDSYQYEFAKLLAVELHYPIGWCAEPHKYIFPFEDRSRRYRTALDFLKSRIDGDFLRVFGSESGLGIDAVLRSVKKTHEETGRHVTLVVDSFHNLFGVGTEEDQTRYKNNSKRLHALASTGTSVLVTAETRKGRAGPHATVEDLAEARAIGYDANLVLMPFNELHMKRGGAMHWWVGTNSVTGEPTKKPVIEMEMVKNKITDSKGAFYYKFIDSESRFEPIQDPPSFFAEQAAQWHELTGQMPMVEGGVGIEAEL